MGLIAGVGALLILCGIALQIAQLVVSIRGRAQRREPTGDPWDGRSLEWSTASPPPAFNFAVLPTVTSEEPYWDIKQQARAHDHLATPEPQYAAIEMPRNSATGFVTAFFAVVTGFCPDLAHLVAGGARAGRRVRDLRGVRLARHP